MSALPFLSARRALHTRAVQDASCKRARLEEPVECEVMWMAIPFTLPSFATLHAAPKHEAWVILSRHEKMPMSSRTKVRTRTSVWKNLNGMPPADRPVTAADCSKSSEARVVHSRITRLGQPDYHLGGRTTLLGLKARFRARRFLQSGPGRIGDVMRSISVQGCESRFPDRSHLRGILHRRPEERRRIGAVTATADKVYRMGSSHKQRDRLSSASGLWKPVHAVAQWSSK